MLPNHSDVLENVSPILPTNPQSTPMSTSLDDAERQPLLSPQQRSIDDSQNIENVAATLTPDDSPTDPTLDVTKPDLEVKTYLWTVLWYTILVVAGVFILVFFIKGFIDAGDVDVSLYLSHLTKFDILEKFDFKKALKRALGGGLSGAAGNTAIMF